MSVDAIFTCVDLHVLQWVDRSTCWASRFCPKRNHFRGQSSSRPLFGHAGCGSIAKCRQRRSCRNFTGGFRSWLPATCSLSTRRSFDHHGKETVILWKKEFRKMKKSLVSHWSEWVENAKWLRDWLWLCRACRRGLHVGLCEEIFARKYTVTHKPTSAQPPPPP